MPWCTINMCTSLNPPGYSHEHKPLLTSMMGRQYYGYRQQEVKIEVNTSSISDKMYLLLNHS